MALALCVKPREVLRVGRDVRVWIDYRAADVLSPVKLWVKVPPRVPVQMDTQKFEFPVHAILALELAAGQLINVGGAMVGWSRKPNDTRSNNIPRIVVEADRVRFPVDRTEEVMS